MPEQFDPYYKWLAIPPDDQPPNHYRLLGLSPFESDAELIGIAADQRMAHLRTFQIGKHSSLSQRLLNEVSAARVSSGAPRIEGFLPMRRLRSVRGRLGDGFGCGSRGSGIQDVDHGCSIKGVRSPNPGSGR